MSDDLLATDVCVGDHVTALVVDVTARTIVLGASASRDWQPQHHDHAYAVEHSKTRDIFLNTPSQAGWIERFLSDWTGPRGRLGRMTFRMRRSVCPGDVLTFEGTVTSIARDEVDCWWVIVEVVLSVAGERMTNCTARVALPGDAADNPWAREGARWLP